LRLTGRRLRWPLLGVAAAVVVLASASSAGGAAAPAGARAWLGHWETNFGRLIFYSLTYTDLSWDNSGTEFSSCALHDCHYHWLLRGMWLWPTEKKWVSIKGTPTGTDYGTIEPCWLGPYSLEVPRAPGNACYSMLLYRYG